MVVMGWTKLSVLHDQVANKLVVEMTLLFQARTPLLAIFWKVA